MTDDYILYISEVGTPHMEVTASQCFSDVNFKVQNSVLSPRR